MTTFARRLALAVVATGAALFAGCATAPTDPVTSETPAATRPSGLLTTRGAVTVIDRGDGAHLCLGGVAESLPPQCAGVPLVEWDWSALDGEYEQQSGVRWGDFAVTGSYDADAGQFTPVEIVPAAEIPEPPDSPSDEPIGTPCADPDGGWRVVDESRVSLDDFHAATAHASTVEGYAATWVDMSRNPAAGADPLDPAVEAQLSDPRYTILNVAVAGDPAAAEASIRALWGGMLCVTRAERTEAELVALLQEIIDGPGVLGGGVDGIAGTVGITVVHDDGSLQEELDDRHGEGLVIVSSALVPA